MKLISLIILFFAASAQAKNYGLFFGLQADPSNALEFWNKKGHASFTELRKKNWQVTDYFGSPEPGRGASLKNFTQVSFNAAIDDAILKIKKGHIVKSDQLLLHISSHGENNEDDHLVQGADGKFFPVNKKLQELIDAAESHGVKLALSVKTCYSGLIQKLDFKNTCMITSAQEDALGYATSNIGLYFASAKNLEEAFLQMRQNAWLSQPTISTNAGQTAGAVNRMFTDFVRHPEYDSKDKLCASFRRSDKLFNGQLDFVAREILKDQLSPALKDEIADYEKKLMQFRRKYPDISPKPFCTTIGYVKEFCFRSEFHVWEYLAIYDKILSDYDNKIDKEGYEYISKNRRALVNFIESPQYKKVFGIGYQSRPAPKDNELLQLAERSADIEKKIYNELYKKFTHKEDPNPCRDFKL